MTRTTNNWQDHFQPPDPQLEHLFSRLQPADCRDILESNALPASNGVAHESAENRVFQYGSTVVKLYRPGRWTLPALQDEHAFLTDLAAANLSVVHPIGPPADWRGLHYQLYQAVPEPFDTGRRTLGEDDLRALVHLTAQVHEVGRKGAAPNRPRTAPDDFPAMFEVVKRSGYLPDHLARRYAGAVDEFAQILSERLDGVPQQRIHGDCGAFNVLWRPAGPLLMDFDDFLTGPVATDVLLLSIGYRLDTIPEQLPRHEQRARQRRHVIELYREVQHFPEPWEHLLEPLAALRDVWFDAWFCSRWHDPAFPPEYPDDDLRTAAWWETNVQNLEKRLALAKH